MRTKEFAFYTAIYLLIMIGVITGMLYLMNLKGDIDYQRGQADMLAELEEEGLLLHE